MQATRARVLLGIDRCLSAQTASTRAHSSRAIDTVRLQALLAYQPSMVIKRSYVNVPDLSKTCGGKAA